MKARDVIGLGTHGEIPDRQIARSGEDRLHERRGGEVAVHTGRGNALRILERGHGRFSQRAEPAAALGDVISVHEPEMCEVPLEEQHLVAHVVELKTGSRHVALPGNSAKGGARDGLRALP